MLTERTRNGSTIGTARVVTLVLLAAFLPVGRQALAQCPTDSLVVCDQTTTSSSPSYSVSGCLFGNAVATYDLVSGNVSVGTSVAGSYVALTTEDIYTITGPAGSVEFMANLAVRAGYQNYGTVTAEIRSSTQSSVLTCPCGDGGGHSQTLSIPLAHAVGDPFRLKLILTGSISSNRLPSRATVSGTLGFTLPPGYTVTSCQGYPGLPTTCTLTSDPNPSTLDETVHLTAGVTPASATGAVTFLDGLAVLGTATLTAGIATFSVSGLTKGIHSLTARYEGDGTYAASSSLPLTQTVNKLATAVQLTGSPNPSVFLEEVKFTATVSFTASGTRHPTGSVQFKIDDVNAGPTVSVDLTGVARMSTSALAAGSHTVQAVYSGDADFEGSTSPGLDQHVTGPNPAIIAVRDVPNDQGGRVFLTWRSPLDKPGLNIVTGYHVWRRAPNPGVEALRAAPAGEVDSRGEPLRTRVVRTTRPDGTLVETFWEALATLPAQQLASYAYEAATIQDSMADDNPFTAFFVTALTADPFVFFQSAPDSGYSVDNLSPPTLGPFAALYLPGSTALHWTPSPAPDFGEFRLYRGIGPNFVPAPSNLVIATRDTGYVDVIQTPYVYKLAATDVHGNASRYVVVTPGGPVATLASLVAVEAQPDRIRLTWYAAGNPGLDATVYRCTANSAWAALGSIASDGTGYLRYEDAAVQVGTRYGYRLGIMDAGSEIFLGEAWATAERLVFEFEGARPNPATGGGLTVAFSLPNAEAASLELIDVSGRRVAVREVGSLGAGPHSLRLGDGRRIAPGIYLLRLTRGGSRLTRRVAVLP